MRFEKYFTPDTIVLLSIGEGLLANALSAVSAVDMTCFVCRCYYCIMTYRTRSAAFSFCCKIANSLLQLCVGSLAEQSTVLL